MSKACKDTKIANIRLNDRKHNYLRVVIRYATVFNKILGTRNQIVTFYGADSPIEGEDICFKKR
jgi:hypothetical protein